MDGFPLSFLEWLPANFSTQTPAPLVIYLHGMGGNATPIPGGGGATTVPAGLVANASAFGAILMSLNTRTQSGFYANTPCGGPQEQDVLDAIALERAHRAVSGVYLVGFSMGTSGAFSIAGHHPGLIRGIGVAAPITDLFQQLAYAISVHSVPLGLIQDYCNQLPSGHNVTAVRLTQYLSVARFHPENFSRVLMYVTGGGLDQAVPTNFAYWPYSQVNSSFVNSSCRVVPGLGEAMNCTTPFWTLFLNGAPGISFRYVYEPTGIHSALQLNGRDLFGYLFGNTPRGFATADFPPTSVHRLPAPRM